MDRVYKALADPTRRHILALLRGRDMTAGELAERFEISKPTLSGHFSVLKQAGLIQGEKTATTITYRLNISVLEEALLGLMNVFDVKLARSKRPSRRSLAKLSPGAKETPS